MIKVALKLKTFGLFEEEEIISHDCQVICQYGEPYNHPKLDAIASDIYKMLFLEFPPILKFDIKPLDITTSVHSFLWASKTTANEGPDIPLELETPALDEMMSTPPRPLHPVPDDLIQPIYQFVYAYYADIYNHFNDNKVNPLGFSLYWSNFINTIGSCCFYDLSIDIFKSFGIAITNKIHKSQVPLDILLSIRHQMLFQNQKIAKVPFQDFLLLQFKEITKSIAVHSKTELEALTGSTLTIEWPPQHLHDLLNQLLPGFNALFSDLLHANQHNPGRVRRLINTFIESIHKIPFNQYDVICSQLTKDANKVPFLGFGVHLMTCMGLFQWLLLGYALNLYESFDLLAYSVQIDYISKTFLKLLEKQQGLANYQKEWAMHISNGLTLKKPLNQQNGSFDVFFVKMVNLYFTGFSKLMIYHDADTKIPFDIGIYDDTFYAHRFQKQFRVLFIGQFPPQLNYEHYLRKINAFRRIERDLLDKDIKIHFNECLEVVQQLETNIKNEQEFDKLTTVVICDMIASVKKYCALNMDSLKLGKSNVNLIKGRHFPHFADIEK